MTLATEALSIQPYRVAIPNYLECQGISAEIAGHHIPDFFLQFQWINCNIVRFMMDAG